MKGKAISSVTRVIPGISYGGGKTHTHTQLLNVSRTASLNLQEVFSAQTETEGSSQFANLYFK